MKNRAPLHVLHTARRVQYQAVGLGRPVWIAITETSTESLVNQQESRSTTCKTSAPESSTSNATAAVAETTEKLNVNNHAESGMMEVY